AVQLLLETRPAVCERVLSNALSEISDPATLSWLLKVLETSSSESGHVLETCQSVFRDLSSRDHLTVRALARRMIVSDPPPLTPSGHPDNALIGRPVMGLWTPAQSYEHHDDDSSTLDGHLNTVAGERINRGEQMLEGLRKAVRSRTK